MAKMPPAAPPKPANQGGKAPANVQVPKTTVSGVNSTSNLPHQYDATSGGWQNHAVAQMPGGTSGSGKGAH